MTGMGSGMRFGVLGLLVSTAATPLLAEGAGTSFFGGPGLIDAPVGASPEDAEISASFSYFEGTQRTALSFQAAPRVNATIRFATLQDADEDGSDLAFRSFDLHFQVVDEGRLVPGVAVGFRDFLGDGVYGAEYIAATKEVLPGVMLTGGVGWGRLATADGFDFGVEDTRELTDPTGRPQFDAYFQGDAAFFAGIEWHTPIPGLTLKADYVEDAYDVEEDAGGLEPSVPFNFAATWSPNEYVSLTGAYLYGDKIGAQLTFTANPRKPLAPPDLGSGPPPLIVRADDAPRGTAWATAVDNREALTTALGEAFAADGIRIEASRIMGDTVDLYIVNEDIQRTPKAIGRIARILASALPASVEVFRITPVEAGLPTTTVELRRSDLEALVDRPDATMQSFERAVFADAAPRLSGPAVVRPPEDGRFFWSLSPRVPLNFFDTDDPPDLDAQIVARASFEVMRGLSVTGELSRFVIGSDQETVSTSTSTLPRVRSDADLYFSGRDVEVERLTADYVVKAMPAVYG
ncbi:MAG: YjbH domain-containing protein, partial [Pseudomonadota bacterium]